MELRQAFYEFLDHVNLDPKYDRDFLFKAFSYAYEGAHESQDVAPLASLGVNPLQLSLYLINEHAFYLATHPERSQEELANDESYLSFLASVSLDKYYTNEKFAYRIGNLTSRFSPAMSTLDLYLNFVLGILSRYQQGDPERTLLVDVMMKGFQMGKCVASLLEEGFETEAFSTWRTLHENECILSILVRHGEGAVEAYLRHIRYGVAFRGGLSSKEETDSVFVDIKARMHEIGLKSKDMKRFIEYGWLTGVKGATEIPDFKFNFRDGVERVAGLTHYSKVYEMASEIAHSSPVLIYSRKNYFYFVTILNLYESFFRLEKFFTSLYMATAGEEERIAYARMRNLYYGELIAAYQTQKEAFANLGKENEK
ncbi:MAG: hypothetical protein IJU64_00520 [Bacilli bacterium]|nr:hypothetical protein [Bacilli bacterium]